MSVAGQFLHNPTKHRERSCCSHTLQTVLQLVWWVLYLQQLFHFLQIARQCLIAENTMLQVASCMGTSPGMFLFWYAVALSKTSFEIVNMDVDPLIDAQLDCCNNHAKLGMCKPIV